MKKSLFSWVASLLVVLLLATACQPTEKATEGDKAVEKTDQEDKAKTNNGEETSKVPDKGEIKYVSMWSETEPQAVTLKQAAEAFTKEKGVKVTVEFVGRQGIREGIQTRLDAQEAIDLFDEDIDRVLGQWGDYLQDLTPYMDKQIDGQSYSQRINPAFDNIYGAVRQLSGDGQVKAIPYQPFIFDMMYNKAIFDEAGVDKVPQTWQEFLTACQKIKEAGYTPITVDNAYITCMLGYTLAAYAGADDVERIVKENDWTNPAVEKAVKVWQEMAEKGYISEYAATNIYPNAQISEFATGDAAMYLNGTWLPNEIKADLAEDVELGIFAFPMIEGAKNGSEAANFGSQVLAVPKNSKQPELAFEFITYVTTGQWDAKLSENSIGIPMDKDNAWPSQLEEAKALFPTLTTRYPWAAGIDNNPDNAATILENFTAVISGEKTAKEFVEAMQ